MGKMIIWVEKIFMAAPKGAAELLIKSCFPFFFYKNNVKLELGWKCNRWRLVE